jgi:hypothetical protein
MAKKEGKKEEVIRLAKLRRSVPDTDFHDPNYKHLTYVRYADEWLIGIRGSYKDAEGILRRVIDYCAGINLKVCETKTKIININKNKVLFLGTVIKRSHLYKYREGTAGIRRLKKLLLLLAPLDIVKRKLTEASFIKRNKPHPKFV